MTMTMTTLLSFLWPAIGWSCVHFSVSGGGGVGGLPPYLLLHLLSSPPLLSSSPLYILSPLHPLLSVLPLPSPSVLVDALNQSPDWFYCCMRQQWVVMGTVEACHGSMRGALVSHNNMFICEWAYRGGRLGWKVVAEDKNPKLKQKPSH